MVKIQNTFLDLDEDTLVVDNHSGFQMSEISVSSFHDIAKRTFDIVFSLMVIILGSPVYLSIGVITYFSSKGPILFSQLRTGKAGKHFEIYKFRSMYVGAVGEHSNGKNDSRITPWGHFMRRTRIDELPQFYNVLTGEMSIVGPRPLADYDVKMLWREAPQDFVKILSLKPGITSMGQIEYGYARSKTEIIDRMKYDIRYIEKKSFFFDIMIIFRTILIMLGAKGK
jgi:lipopolysaccharide/colanic/teichoic acid biosynthesis glycosyltransferase